MGSISKYEILTGVGRGNMGVVSLARDPFLIQSLALKVAHRPTDGATHLCVGAASPRLISASDHLLDHGNEHRHSQVFERTRMRHPTLFYPEVFQS